MPFLEAIVALRKQHVSNLLQALSVNVFVKIFFL